MCYSHPPPLQLSFLTVFQIYNFPLHKSDNALRCPQSSPCHCPSAQQMHPALLRILCSASGWSQWRRRRDRRSNVTNKLERIAYPALSFKLRLLLLEVPHSKSKWSTQRDCHSTHGRDPTVHPKVHSTYSCEVWLEEGEAEYAVNVNDDKEKQEGVDEGTGISLDGLDYVEERTQARD